MSRVRKILLWAAGVLVTLSLVAAGLGVWAVRRPFPAHDGEQTLPGLTAPVTVLRDEQGIPQIYADSEEDLYRAQGYVHSQDRFWEMDFRRHVTAGRVAELFGASQVETDRYLRTMGWRRVAEQEWALLQPATKRALVAYAAGVNGWLEAHAEAVPDGFTPNGGLALEYTVLGLQNSGYVIEPWQPVDSLAWLKAMAWDLRGNMQDEIEREQLLLLGLTRDQVGDLYPEYPYDRHSPVVHSPLPLSSLTSTASARGADEGRGIGSNSWVISGKLTETGKPILANDPHLSPSQPGIWYQIGLHCACAMNVAGFGFAGVPGIVIGHNARIAWGFTNLGPDVIDLYREKLDGAEIRTRTETIKVAGGDDVNFQVRSTKHGPLLSDASEELAELAGDEDTGIAIRWTALDPGRTADALFALNQAAGWEDFRAAAALFEVPAQNMIYADIDGNIGYQAPGTVPIRSKGDGRWIAPGWDPEYEWIGTVPFDELPSSFNPEQGYLVTANQAAAGPDGPYLTSDWAYGYRSQRLNDMFAEHVATEGTFSVSDVERLQFDNRNGFAAELVPSLLATIPADSSDLERRAIALLDGWDYQQPVDSAAAAYYNVVWRQLLGLTFDELGDDHFPGGGSRWFEVMRALLDQPQSDWWDVQSTAEVETRDDILAQALRAAAAELADTQGGDPAKWQWGKIHTLTPTHATFGESGIGPLEWLFNQPAAPTAGGTAIVNATGWDAGQGYQVDAVPSMRMVVDLADLDRSRWIQLTGNSGHAFHPNYADQFELWRTGRTLPFHFSRSELEQRATATLQLNPASPSV